MFALGTYAAVLEKQAIKSDPEAVCNDGSLAVYYIKKNSQSKNWLIYLEAGGQCYDEDSCVKRWNSSQNLMSSIGY